MPLDKDERNGVGSAVLWGAIFGIAWYALWPVSVVLLALPTLMFVSFAAIMFREMIDKRRNPRSPIAPDYKRLLQDTLESDPVARRRWVRMQRKNGKK